MLTKIYNAKKGEKNEKGYRNQPLRKKLWGY